MKIKFKVANKIIKKGYPTTSKDYKTSHNLADKVEKKKYPIGYEKMKRVDAKLPGKEMAGTHTKSGKITVSKKVPKSNRKEVALHEFVEWKKDRAICSKCKKSRNKH